MPPLLDDGHAAAHRLPDAEEEWIDHRRVARDELAGREPLQHLLFCCLTRSRQRGVRQSHPVVLGAALADAEMVDGHEDPAAFGMPFGLGTPGRGSGEVDRVVALRVAAARFGEAHDGIAMERVGVGHVHRQRNMSVFAQSRGVGDIDFQINALHGRAFRGIGTVTRAMAPGHTPDRVRNSATRCRVASRFKLG